MSIARAVCLFAVAGLLAAPSAAGADGAVAPGAPAGVAAVTVDSLVAEALAHSPALGALRARAAAAGERVRPAGAPSDPTVGFSLQDVGFPTLTIGEQEMSMAAVDVRQPLGWPGRRPTLRAAATAESHLAVAEAAAAGPTLAAEVRIRAGSLWALDREQTALLYARELLAMLAATVAARYGGGEGDQGEVLRQQLEGTRVDERLTDLATERAEAVSGLNRLLGRSGDTPIWGIADLPDLTPAADWADSVVARAPAVAVRRAAVRAAAGRLAVARVDEKPGLAAGAGYGYRGGFDPVVTLRVDVELPLWRDGKQAALRRAADWELVAARADLAEAEAAASAEAAALGMRWHCDDAQVTRYRESIVPRTSAAFDAARAAFLAGRGDFAAAVDGFRMWLDARVGLARREAARFATGARIAALRGGADTAADAARTGGGS